MSAIRRHLAVCVVSVLAGCGEGGGGNGSRIAGPGPVTNTAGGSVTARVVTIGDSITAGKVPVVAYPPRLEALLKRRNLQAVVIDSFFTDDGFHPNDKGQTATAVTFGAALASAGYPTAQFAHRRR